MVKTILFDFWGTLVENGTYSPLRQTYNILRVRMPFSPFVVKMESVFMTKTFDDQKSAFEAVCTALNIDSKPFVIDKLIGVWNKNKLLAKPYEETVPVLEELKKKGYKLGLLANCPHNSVMPVLEKFDLAKYFDVIILSWETGLLKTDKEMFEMAMKKLRIRKKENILMVGDSIPTDMDGAKNAGIKPVLVDRKDRRDYEDKIVDLTELKKFLK